MAHVGSQRHWKKKDKNKMLFGLHKLNGVWQHNVYI